MDIPALLTLIEALTVLSTRTARAWSRSDLFNLVVNLALPLRSRTPSTAQPVIREGDGFVSAQLPYPGRHLAVLSTSQIKDLWRHGETQTRLVALEPGDPGYLDWKYIKGLRAAPRATACSPDSCTADAPDSGQHDEEIMGECDVSRFNEAVRVTDDTCLVPHETIEELLAYVAGHKTVSGTRESSNDSATDSTIQVQREHTDFAATSDDAGGAVVGTGSPELVDADESYAALFDPVTAPMLEKMFSAPGKWSGWCKYAARNGLVEAREGRAKFNPYRAGMWFLKQGIPGWDLIRCHRVLANNLPARSRHEVHRLIGLLD